MATKTQKPATIVTNNKLIIEKSEYIYYLKDGSISEHGTYADLMAKEDGTFKLDMYKETVKKEPKPKKEKRAIKKTKKTNA